MVLKNRNFIITTNRFERFSNDWILGIFFQPDKIFKIYIFLSQFQNYESIVEKELWQNFAHNDESLYYSAKTFKSLNFPDKWWWVSLWLTILFEKNKQFLSIKPYETLSREQKKIKTRALDEHRWILKLVRKNCKKYLNNCSQPNLSNFKQIFAKI